MRKDHPVTVWWQSKIGYITVTDSVVIVQGYIYWYQIGSNECDDTESAHTVEKQTPQRKALTTEIRQLTTVKCTQT